MTDISQIRSLFVLVACLTALAGCANGPQPGADQREADTPEREPHAPTPEQLAESPCGNPNWGQLPEQHAIDGDPDEQEDEQTDEEPSSSEEQPSGGETQPSQGQQPSDEQPSAPAEQ